MPCFGRVAVVLLSALFLLPATASAVPLLDTFGGPVGYGTNMLPINDDDSSPPISLTAAFPGGLTFFGGPYSTIYVNNNGNVTFNGELYVWTPSPFPIADQPMIAPYWGDVDTRGGGTPTQNSVWWHLEPGRMVVTWHQVGYFAEHDDHKMDFQMIITNSLDCTLGDFDVEFRYNVCGWTTGDASGGSGGFGGTPAQAGFDAGNLRDFVELPGSRTMSILDLCTTSNVGEPGIWRFTVRGGMVTCPDTGEPCMVPGEVGACAIGLNQCVGREIECRPVSGMSSERCDGVDNDCNGMTDDGDLCDSPDICVRGICVPPCFEGGCAVGETCTTEGSCVETACIDVECPPGERCRGGVCGDLCAGVICPHGQQCFAGHCTDLCEVLTCDTDEVCVDGACVPTCPCRLCDSDETCLADGTCESIGCDLVICPDGEYCDGGECLDSCEGAICPDGESCMVGDCVPMPEPMPDAGPPPERDAAPPERDAGTDGTDAGGGMDAAIGPPGRRDTGCGCMAGGGATGGAGALLPFLLVLALLVRRRSDR